MAAAYLVSQHMKGNAEYESKFEEDSHAKFQVEVSKLTREYREALVLRENVALQFVGDIWDEFEVSGDDEDEEGDDA